MASHPLQNFENTLEQLKAFCAEPIQNDRDRAGIIQAFEFTFEQSWHSIQKVITKFNVKTPTPKQAFMAAMMQGWIEKADEDIWLKMIEDRNLTSHTYREALAKEVLGRVMSIYIALFEKLLARLHKEI